MNAWSLRTRLLVLLGTMGVLLAGAGALALHGMGEAVASADSLYRDRAMPLQQLHSLNRAYSQTAMAAVHRTLEKTLTPAQAALQLAEVSRTAQQQWQDYQATYLVPEEKALIAQITPLLKRADAAVAKARGLIESRDDTALASFAAREMREAFEPVNRAIDQLLQVQLVVGREQTEGVQLKYERLAWIVALMVVLALVAGAAIAASAQWQHMREQRLALQAAQSALQRFQRVFYSAPTAAVIVTRGEARIRDVNDVMCRRYQLPRSAFIGRTMRDLDIGIIDEDNARFTECLKQRGHVEQLPVKVRLTEGSVRDILLSAEPIELDGEACLLLMGLDFTERRRAEEALKALNVKLEQRVAERTAQLRATIEALQQSRDSAEAAAVAKSQFLANVSHELRTPIHAVLGLTHLMLNTRLDERQQGYMAKSKIAADTLLALIDHVLSFSKAEAGKLLLERVPFRIDGILEQLAAMLAPLAESKGLALTFNKAAAVPETLLGDGQRLQQVLLNLCNNAIKFTPSGQVSVHVEVREQDGATCLLDFVVRDSGIGMDNEQVARLFQPFMQADASTSRLFGGTGLGLAISRQLVELMGGSIEVRSTPGLGSDFSFTARFGLATDAARVVPAGPQHERAAWRVLQGRRVLLVEDNELNQLVAAELLRTEAGMHVDVVDSGAAALARLREQAFDVVLLDVQLPGMDGFEVIRHIRETPALARLPVIAVTGNASAQDREACLQAGMDEYVSKPFDPERLYRVLSKVVGLAHRPFDAGYDDTRQRGLDRTRA